MPLRMSEAGRHVALPADIEGKRGDDGHGAEDAGAELPHVRRAAAARTALRGARVARLSGARASLFPGPKPRRPRQHERLHREEADERDDEEDEAEQVVKVPFLDGGDSPLIADDHHQRHAPDVGEERDRNGEQKQEPFLPGLDRREVRVEGAERHERDQVFQAAAHVVHHQRSMRDPDIAALAHGNEAENVRNARGHAGREELHPEADHVNDELGYRHHEGEEYDGEEREPEELRSQQRQDQPRDDAEQGQARQKPDLQQRGQQLRQKGRDEQKQPRQVRAPRTGGQGFALPPEKKSDDERHEPAVAVVAPFVIEAGDHPAAGPPEHGGQEGQQNDAGDDRGVRARRGDADLV